MVNSKVSTRHALRFGTFVDRQMFSLYDSLQVDTTMGWRTLTGADGAAYLVQPYLQWKWRLSEAFSATAGLHAQVFTQNQSKALEPRAAIKWAFSDRQSLGFAYGEHSQMQPMYVYFVETADGSGESRATNSDLGFTRNRHFVLSYDWNISLGLRLKSEAYYQNLYGVPVEGGASSSFSLINEGSDYVVSVRDSLENEGKGKNYGIELTLEKFFGSGYYFLVTGTIFQSQYTGSDGVWRNTAFNNNYTLTALGGYELRVGKKKRVLIGIDGRIATAGGKWYTPVNLAASQTSVFAVYEDDRAFSERLKGYFRADLRAKVRLNSKKISQEWAFDVSNIFNTKNPLNIVYDLTSKSLRTNYQIGFFPVVQYRIEF